MGDWRTLTDDELLSIELTTDDPEALDNLVRVIPLGDEETFAEYKYDLNARRDMLVCAHCHQKHLHGFVMRKGDARYLLGWKCGETLHGLNFGSIVSDYTAKVNRQDTLRRSRNIRELLVPLQSYLEPIASSDVFTIYEKARKGIRGRLSWIWENAHSIPRHTLHVNSVSMPPTLFVPETDPKALLDRAIAETKIVSAKLENETFEATTTLVYKRYLERISGQIEKSFDQLSELVQFFQPKLLGVVCEFAWRQDMDAIRYEHGLSSITRIFEDEYGVEKREVVKMPRDYKLPNRGGLESLKKALLDI